MLVNLVQKSVYKNIHNIPLLVLQVFLIFFNHHPIQAQTEDSFTDSISRKDLEEFIRSYQPIKQTLPSNFEEIDRLNKYLTTADSLDDTQAQLFILNELALLLYNSGDREHGEQIAYQLLNQATEVENYEAAFGGYKVLYYLVKPHDIDSAEVLSSKMLDISESLDLNHQIVARTYLAYSFIDKEKYYDALNILNQNLDQLETAPNDSLYSITYSALSPVYARIEDNKALLRYRLKAYEFAKKNGSPELISTTGLFLGTAYRLFRNYEQATPLIEDALAYRKKHSNARDIGEALQKASIIYTETGRFDEAIELLKESAKLFRSINNNRLLCLVYTSIGRLSLHLNRIAPAKEYFKLSEALVKDSDFWLVSKKQTYLGLMKIAELESDFERAYTYSQLLLAVENQIQLDRRNREVGFAEAEAQAFLEQERQNAKFESELAIKESQIQNRNRMIFGSILFLLLISTLSALLYNSRKRQKKSLQIISGQNIELSELNIIKNNYFTILAHDLRTPFGTILRMSELVHSFIKTNELEEIEPIVDLLEKSTFQFNKMLDDTLEWGKLQMKGFVANKKTISLAETVNKSVAHLKASALEKEIDLVIENIPQISVSADPDLLDRVLNNVITNAIKYTPRFGKIEISTKLEDNIAILSVKDNGIGISAKKLEQIFDTKGFVKTKGTEGEPGIGFGLTNAKKMAELNGGALAIKSEEGKGTKVSFTLESASQP